MSEHNHGFERARFTKTSSPFGQCRTETVRLFQDGCVEFQIVYLMDADATGHTRQDKRKLSTESFAKELAASGYEEEL